jgi:N-acetylated-alpha-linked acidic dipeptidase
MFLALVDPKKKMVAPTKEPIPPYLNFAPLDNAADELTRASDAYEKTFQSSASQTNVTALNLTLMKAEHMLTSKGGLPGRPWFENLIYAPGFYTGYDAKTLPGVREAIEQKRWTQAEEQIALVAKALQAEADLLDEATKQLTSH